MAMKPSVIVVKEGGATFTLEVFEPMSAENVEALIGRFREELLRWMEAKSHV
jgi:hypothetical protein